MTETLVAKINPKELPVGAELEIHTQNSVYTLRVHEDGMTIQGGGKNNPMFPTQTPFRYDMGFTGNGFEDRIEMGYQIFGTLLDPRYRSGSIRTSQIKKMILRDPAMSDFIDTRVADEIPEVDLSKLEIGTSVLASTKHNTYLLKITESPANKDYSHITVKIIGGKRFPEFTDFIYLYARVEDHNLPSRIRIGFSMHGIALHRRSPLDPMSSEKVEYEKGVRVRIKPIRHIEVLAPDVNNVTPFRQIKKVR